MNKKKQKPTLINNQTIDEKALFTRVSEIIENRKASAGAYANREVTLMYWEIGQFVGSALLGGTRAEYGKRIVATLSQQLVRTYGRSFEYTGHWVKNHKKD
ncbi:MAG: DUF1016 N-terminal domain-containing protein [Spirochaetaceae bacterium]|nr:DUF1016 N-terminal domain-containing protein [Spirochaetaceae bacterium]